MNFHNVIVGTLTPCPHINCNAIYVNGTSGKPSPTDREKTFMLNFVGDGFLHVPKRYRYFNINSTNNLFKTTRSIINSERSDL